MSEPQVKKRAVWVENVKTLFYAFAIALFIRSFMFQPFSIPSGSMKPCLLVGDYLFVAKYGYGYSRHSMPFSPPLFSGRIFGALPQRGDVTVFKLPRDNRTDFIKRIIGLPGDKVQMRGGVLYLNDIAVKRERVADFVEPTLNGDKPPVRAYRETLPNGVSYIVLDSIENSATDNTDVYYVPHGHYFMMGDNRDNSADSRIAHYVGFVPYENLVGPARFLFFSYDGDTSLLAFWRWPWAIRFARLFDAVE